jgi:hypothetical protein
MSDTTPDAVEQGQASEAPSPEVTAPAVEAPAVEATSAASTSTSSEATDTISSGEESTSFSERYGEILGKVNQTLDSVDWNQMGRIGKATGVIVAVIVAQVLIKGVLDTINLIPIVPGLLELLGLVVVGQWSWKNLTTSEKRNAVISRIQSLRKEYLG